MANLNLLLADKDGFKELKGVGGINGSGWICGDGTKSRESHAYVAIPLP